MDNRFIKIDGYVELPAYITPNMFCLAFTEALKNIDVIDFTGTIRNREDCLKEDEVNCVTVVKL
jgi:hypothetical protein